MIVLSVVLQTNAHRRIIVNLMKCSVQVRGRDVAVRLSAGEEKCLTFPKSRGSSSCENSSVQLITGNTVVHNLYKDLNVVADIEIRRLGWAGNTG